MDCPARFPSYPLPNPLLWLQMDCPAPFPCYPCPNPLLGFIQMGCPAPFPCYPRSIPRLGVVVTNGLSCTFSLLSRPYPGVRGRGGKCIALHLFSAFPALPRKPWFQIDCPAPFPCYLRHTLGFWSVVTNKFPAPFPCYARPTPGLGTMGINGLPCTFSLISPPYSGVGGHGYKWIALYRFPVITALPRDWGRGCK